jgi:hypothetical protein
VVFSSFLKGKRFQMFHFAIFSREILLLAFFLFFFCFRQLDGYFDFWK